MKVKKFIQSIAVFAILFTYACGHDGYEDSLCQESESVNVLFLHHSTGHNIYNGAKANGHPDIKVWFDKLNADRDIHYNVVERAFPLSKKFRYLPGYGWNNYPHDYYNIWVKNGEKAAYKFEPTLKTLTPLWDVIIFKHCFPVSAINEDDILDINSTRKTIANYKLQYEALKKKMREYPDTKFIVWTGAALTKSKTNEASAIRARKFFNWVKQEWDEPNDNIFLWDFYELETEGGLYLLDEYAIKPSDSHPNKEFSARVAPLFCQRVVDVIERNGAATLLTGEYMLSSSVDSTLMESK